MYADNDFKFVAILNEKVDLPKLMNALGHMTAGLVAQCEDRDAMRFLCYEDADGGKHAAISHYPFILLAARNSNQIRSLREVAVENRIIYNDFVGTMLGTSSEDQVQKTRATREKDLEYFGICLFGPAEVLNEMTRKFSLFKGGRDANSSSG
jgi:hypothetical protein